MEKFKWLLPVLLLGLLVSCQNKIDSSSDAAFNNSIRKIGESMSDDEKLEFLDAIKIISFSDLFDGSLDLEKIMKVGSGKEKVKDIKSKMNGMTAAEVIKEANRIKERIRNKE